MKTVCPYAKLHNKGKKCRHVLPLDITNLRWESKLCKTCSERYSSNFEEVLVE